MEEVGIFYVWPLCQFLQPFYDHLVHTFCGC
jgi:hypothetical protein